MNSIKNLVYELNRGKQLDINIPFYKDVLKEIYNQTSFLHLAMEYYVLYEILQEREGRDNAYLSEDLSVVHKVMEQVFCREKDLSLQEVEECITEIEEVRSDVIRKMELLTMYTDKLQIYEHVVNRMELQFETDFEETDVESFVKQTLQFIFSGEDNVVINENIKEVLAELPVRMARSKYFQLIENSMSVYKGSDKSALDRFVYMLETSAMLYEPEGVGEYFNEIQEFADSLDQCIFAEMSEHDFSDLYDSLEEYAGRIEEIANLYVDIQTVLNSLYGYLLSYSGRGCTDNSEEACLDILRTLHQMFVESEWKAIPEEVAEKLVLTEGKQEKLAEDMIQLQGAFYKLVEGHQDKIEKLGLVEEFVRLEMEQQLLSVGSTFVDFHTEEEEVIAEEDYVLEKTEELIGKLKDRFAKQEMCVNRAVIAATISKFPVFFTSSKEVEEYIREALTRCKDIAERQASMNLIQLLWDGTE
ncbi:MAG: hypothetical protein HDT30_02585 [Clostridiales bacterium]|nr:hypothetical protein [Clostridiales bacterium]